MNSKIKAIYDNEGETIDRYTVYFNEVESIIDGTPIHPCLAMNERPYHPLGFCQHSTGMMGDHNGKEISFNQLPEDCRNVIIKELT